MENNKIDKNLGYYNKFTNFNKIIDLGLENRRPEANYPLIKLAKKYLNINMQEATTSELKQKICELTEKIEEREPGRTKELFSKKFLRISNDPKEQKTLYKQLVPLIDKQHEREAEWYFRFGDDSYAKAVVDSFLGDKEHYNQFTKKLRQWAEKAVAEKIKRKIGIENFTSDPLEIKKINQAIDNIVKGVAHPFKSKRSLVNEGLKTLSDSSVLKEHGISISEENFQQVKNQVKTGVNNALMAFLKRKQYEEINRYDGLQEHFTPMSMRGLANLDRSTVQKIAKEGDFPSAHDLFNHEVSSRARRSYYARGHTGKSNRSTTIASKIATYFGTGFGFKRGIKETIWYTIYESKKGLFMSEIEPEGGWKEAEIVTPYLKPNRFLGAVQFTVDKAESERETIRLVPSDGFISEKVRNGTYRKEGAVGKIFEFLELAKKFDPLNEEEKAALHKTFFLDRSSDYIFEKYPKYYGPQPMTKEENDEFIKTKLRPFQQKVSSYESSHLKEFLPKPLPSRNFNYKLGRLPQRYLAKVETEEEKGVRHARERKRARELTTKFTTEKGDLFPTSITKNRSKRVLEPENSEPQVQLSSFDRMHHGLNYFIQNYYSKKFPPIEKRIIQTAPFFSPKAQGNYAAYEAMVEETGVARYLHGSMHAARASLWTLMLANLLNKNNLPVSLEEIESAVIASSSHDAAREDEGKDLWDEMSGELLEEYLKELKYPEEKIREIVNAVKNKEKIEDFDSSSHEHCLLHDSDALEILRTGKFKRRNEKFDMSKLVIFNKLTIPKEMKVHLLREVRKFINFTETNEHKLGIEKTDTPLFYLLNVLQSNKNQFPMIYSLLKKEIKFAEKQEENEEIIVYKGLSI